MSPPLTALTFLTRLPIRRGAAPSLKDVAGSQAWFVPVGLLLGLALLAVDRVCTRALPVGSVAVIDVVALIAFTGGLHLDGLADSADGLIGGHDRESRLAIMRDPRAGVYAIVAIVSVFALKIAGIAGLPSDVRFEALVLTPAFARFAMLAGIAVFPYARPEGMGLQVHAASSPGALFAAAVVALTAALVLFGPQGTYVLAFSTLCGLAIGFVSTRLNGGLTGDVYGATVELTEAATFLFIAAFATRGWLDAWLFG